MAGRLDEVALFVPSDYHSLVRRHPAMSALVAMELRLRQGEANEALEDLRLHLTTQMSLVDRKKQGSGTIQNTAMDRRIHGKRDAIERAKFAYRRARVALIVLGMSKKDPKYKVLHDSDCKAFVIVDEEVRRGDSQLDPTWIWGDFSYMGKLDEGKIKSFVTNSECDSWPVLTHADSFSFNRCQGALAASECVADTLEGGGERVARRDVPDSAVLRALGGALGRARGQARRGRTTGRRGLCASVSEHECTKWL